MSKKITFLDKINKMRLTSKSVRHAQEIQEQKVETEVRLKEASALKETELYELYETGPQGISEEKVEEQREKYGENVVDRGKKKFIIRRIVEAFIDPFTLVLVVLAIVSFITDIAMAQPGDSDWMTVIIIMTMVIISGVLRFVQEERSGKAADSLLEMIETTTNIERIETGQEEIPLDEVVVGDIVHLAAGDMIPADIRVLRCKDLFISQSALTGESEPVEKFPVTRLNVDECESITDITNLAFMGTTVVSGSAVGIVIANGRRAIFGAMAEEITKGEDPPTAFEEGVNSVSLLLIRFMLVMVPIVFILSGFTKGQWMDSFLFAISIAVGLTPEMLPMIVTTSLAKGSVSMSKEKVIIKNLNSMQDFGAMDVLCTDKTGTLTQDRIVLEYHMDVMGEENDRVLRHAFLNSYFQTGLKNLLDRAIIDATIEEGKEKGWGDLSKKYTKVDEVPFDFIRRRMSVVVSDSSMKTQMITKGAVEEMLNACSFVEYEGEVTPLTDELKETIMTTVNDLNDDGMRVLAIAQKTNPSPVGAFSEKDEVDMVLMGYLAFLDPPKDSTEEAIRALEDYGVRVKVLTGDNARVTRTICRQVGINVDKLLLGSDVDEMSDEQLAVAVEEVDVFAKLTPDQKARIVTRLRANDHVVGHLGDGINDAAAMRVADVGISVDNAVDIAKESADVILLEKDLMVLEKGIIEGRKTYANMIKYIKMTASSNFGNVFSVLIASAFLPFLPMTSIQLILLNLIYDISCTAIPWDNVDEYYLKVPRKWDTTTIKSFMMILGPTSSIFDITTYVLMYFLIAPMAIGQHFRQITDPAIQAQFIAIFQTGWFIVSMWTQSMVIHALRTSKVPFVQSVASFPVITLTLTGCIIATVLPYTNFGGKIGLAPVPNVYFAWLAVTLVAYLLVVSVAKKLYMRKYGELL